MVRTAEKFNKTREWIDLDEFFVLTFNLHIYESDVIATWVHSVTADPKCLKAVGRANAASAAVYGDTVKNKVRDPGQPDTATDGRLEDRSLARIGRNSCRIRI